MTDFCVPLRSEIQARRRGRPLLLSLDYDGTLVEIAPRPELARPTPELLELLIRLVAQRDLKVMVVSGRPLRDLQELLPVPGLNFLGPTAARPIFPGVSIPCRLPPQTMKNFAVGVTGWGRACGPSGDGGLRTSLSVLRSTIGRCQQNMRMNSLEY